jgi:hypothetical protein
MIEGMNERMIELKAKHLKSSKNQDIQSFNNKEESMWLTE